MLLLLLPLVWAASASPPLEAPAPRDSSARPRRFLLRIGVPLSHIEETPHLDDDPADPVQLEPLAVGPEDGGYRARLAPLALLPTRDCAMLSPLGRYPQLPPRPPPAIPA